MTLDKAVWLFFMLPLGLTIIGGFAYEAVKQYLIEAEQNRQRVRDLHQQNYQLRDEIARLKHQR